MQFPVFYLKQACRRMQHSSLSVKFLRAHLVEYSVFFGCFTVDSSSCLQFGSTAFLVLVM